MPWSRALSGLVLLTGLVAMVFGCRQEVPPLFRQNRAPETSITVVVEESTTAFYRYHVYWRGEDADGQVVRYLFAITDTLAADPDDRWDPSLAVDRDVGTYTTKTDSVFLFDSGLGTQTLNIVAIDDFGVMDPSPARQYFRVTDNGTPRAVYNEVRTPGGVPCAPADPCTIPMYNDFQVRFSGTTPNGRIDGVTWSPNLGLFQPFNANNDTTFLFLPLDTLVVGTTTVGTQDTLWTVMTDTTTVYHYSTRDDPIPSGPFEYKVNMLDDARRTIIPPAGDRVVTVNYDPQTRIYSVSECDCPNPPPNPDCNNMVEAGWITGIAQTDWAMNDPVNPWRLFCVGDTLPNLAKVVFYANGEDDPRDGAFDPGAGLEETNYKFRFEFSGPTEVPRRVINQNMPLSNPALLPEDLMIPGGGTFRGAPIGWTTCGFDYRFQASAQDEQGRTDGTAATLDFYANGSPVMDSLNVPSVFVFVPTCNGIWVSSCPNPDSVMARFAGTDTMPVFGTWVGDSSDFLAMGSNEFVFPFKGWAHDHMRDKNPPGENWYEPGNEGRIRAWRYTFDCTEPLCQDQVIPGEGAWRTETRIDGVDPPNQEVFDEDLTVTIAIDTFCTTTPCTFADAKSYLKSSRFGPYEFTLQGRDTDPFGARCAYPENLNPEMNLITIDISEQGRRTETVTRNTVWLRYRELRPSKPQGNKPQASAPFVNRKRLMK